MTFLAATRTLRVTRRAALLMCAACALAAGALAVPRTARAALRVVATLPSLAAIAQEVGGSCVQAAAMAAPSQDPHFVDARPSHVVALSRADLLLANGLELEVGWLPPLQIAARNARVQVGAPGFLEVAQLVDLLEVPQVRIDRAMGDLHTGGNPHFLNEPRRVGQVARGVAVRMGQLDPAHSGAYTARADAFADRLEALWRRTRAPLRKLSPERRRVVAYHKSLAYLLEWLGLEEAAVLEPRPGVSPDPRHVAQVLSTMRQRNVSALVQEEYYPTRVAETLSKLSGVPVVVVPGNVRFTERQPYEAYFESIARSFSAALVPVKL